AVRPAAGFFDWPGLASERARAFPAGFAPGFAAGWVPGWAPGFAAVDSAAAGSLACAIATPAGWPSHRAARIAAIQAASCSGARRRIRLMAVVFSLVMRR